jgi:DHA1 family multidrug resistance protein-like MFS transporter
VNEASERHSAAGREDWRRVLTVFFVTSLVEGMGVSQVFALQPALLDGMGVHGAERLTFVGLFSSLLFVLGMPLVPLWGVWADRYSRKVVIARSAFVETVVFTGLALAHEPWQVAICVLLVGLQLGNTGVMLGAIRDSAPRARLGTILALFGASGAIGFAAGPALAGVLIDGAGWKISGVFALSAGLSVATGLLVLLGPRDVQPEHRPDGPLLRLAFGALRGVLGDPAVRRIFVIFGTAFLANQMARPYIPVLVEGVTGTGPGLTSGIGLVAGGAALAGALIAPGGGALGDRVGFRPILVGALVAGAFGMFAMPFAGGSLGIAGLAIVAVAVAGCQSVVSAMVFGLLGTEVPAERRSQTFNLVYLPLYLAGIVGPAVGSLVVGLGGVAGPFLLGAAVLAIGAAGVVRAVAGQPGRSRSAGPM